MNNEKRLRQLRGTLVDLLGGAVGDDRIVTVDELKRAGIPTKWASGISRASRAVTTGEEALDVADDYAREIATEIEKDAARTPEETLARIGRL